MAEPLDVLLATTFTTPEVAAEALAKAKGNPVAARVALAKKKSAPLDPRVGPNVVALVAAARKQGTPTTQALGGLRVLAYPMPGDFAALVFAGSHWALHKVDLGGAQLYAPGVTVREPALQGTAEYAFRFGTLASGDTLVLRLHRVGSASLHAVSEGGERTFATLDDLLGTAPGCS